MGTRLGFHGIGSGISVGVVQAAKAAGGYVPTVKSVDAIDWLAEAKAADPRVITVGRFREGVNGVMLEAPTNGPEYDEAVRAMNLVMPRWEPRRQYVDYWELFNENDPGGPEGHARFARIYMHAMDIAHANGYKMAILSYSTGVPEWPEMKAVADTGIFAKAKAQGHVFALHEYAWPATQYYPGGLPNVPGSPVYDNRGAMFCRYRWWYEDFLKPRNEVIPLILTEVGLIKDINTITAQQWMNEWAWYDTQLMQDNYVMGCHMYGTGFFGGGWGGYNFDRHEGMIKGYIIDRTRGQEPPDPSDFDPGDVDPPPPPPDPEEKDYTMKNANFESAHYMLPADANRYPANWTMFYKTGLPGHDPANKVGYVKPETDVILKQEPYLNPLRVYEGGQAFKLFTFWKIHDAGLYQQMDAIPGYTYGASAVAHAWSSSEDKANESTGVGSGPFSRLANDMDLTTSERNILLQVGIDPTGGTDAFADTVVWGPGIHNYNVFDVVPEIEVIAQADKVTVFLRSNVLWPLKHCDVYWDAVNYWHREPGTQPPPPTDPTIKELEAAIRWVAGKVDEVDEALTLLSTDLDNRIKYVSNDLITLRNGLAVKIAGMDKATSDLKADHEALVQEVGSNIAKGIELELRMDALAQEVSSNIAKGIELELRVEALEQRPITLLEKLLAWLRGE